MDKSTAAEHDPTRSNLQVLGLSFKSAAGDAIATFGVLVGTCRLVEREDSGLYIHLRHGFQPNLSRVGTFVKKNLTSQPYLFNNDPEFEKKKYTNGLRIPQSTCFLLTGGQRRSFLFSGFPDFRIHRVCVHQIDIFSCLIHDGLM
jgi:hypothetical protein